METFSSRLSKFRELRGLSREATGKLLGISGKYVGMIERDEKPVDADSSLARLFAMLEAEDPDERHQAPESTGGGNSHTVTARAKLKAAREAKGLSIAALAKAVGYTPSVYRDIEEGSSQMGEKMVAKVAKVLGIAPEDLTNGGDHVPERGAIRGTFGTVPQLRMGPGMESSRVKFVPLLSMAQCGTMHSYDDTAYAHDGFIAFDSKDPQAFAVTLAGDSMQPRYDAGDVAVVYPGSTARNGDLVIARLTDKEGGDVMFKVFQAAGEQVKLSSYNPTYQPLEWHRSAFQWVYPVASVTKVFR